MEAQVRRWLSSLNGTRSDPVVDEMRGVGTETVFPLLRDMLADANSEVRCAGILVLVLLDSRRAVEVLASMLADPDATVRCQAAGCLHDFGDMRAIPALSPAFFGIRGRENESVGVAKTLVEAGAEVDLKLAACLDDTARVEFVGWASPTN